ncbi:hypothetical protein ES288_A07G228700v1 [Gossypium darwinii]|uniref:Uncharacterized protein n=1 Tax=Gossypium darwinii TaxID=34276 RepID=A0A5D2G023_GOSDA|nr:hypothetical protein ES288_A07G228700v1 [Gossypium darwinii]
MLSQLMHSSSPFHQTPSKVPHAMAADDTSTTPSQVWWTWGVGRATR